MPQDLLLRTLKAKQNRNIAGLSPPALKPEAEAVVTGHSKNPDALQALVNNRDPLLRELQPGRTFEDHSLDPPTIRQDTLLRQLKAGQTAQDHRLDPPSLKQDTLLRQLQGGVTSQDH